MKILTISCLAILLLVTELFAQNVGVGTATPDPTAKLDVASTTSGFLPPRLTTSQRDAIPGPARGLVIYNLTTDCLEFWNGAKWISTCTSAPECSPPPTPVAVDQTLCAGQTLQLSCGDLGSGMSYLWNGPNGYTGTGRTPAPIVNAQPGHAGQYTVRSWAFGCYSDPDTAAITVLPHGWTRKADFPSTLVRQQCVYFSLGDRCYVAAGANSANNTCYTEFWEYNTVANTWRQRAPIPIAHRAAQGFGVGDKGYLVGGWTCCCGPAQSHFFEYDTTSNTWANLSPSPGGIRHHGFAAATATLGFMGFGGSAGGCTGSALNSFYEWDPAATAWTAKAAPVGIAPCFVGGFAMNDKVYVLDNNRAFFEFTNGSPGSWTSRAGFPGATGSQAGYFAVGGYGYVLSWNKTFWRYDPAANSWTQLPCDFPGSTPTSFGVGNLTVNGKGYYIDTSTLEVWEYTP
ncbi:MAG: hypothetical protein KF690_00215 [Bacteroidetes bacterium]|nr:hypothetical protein [Bacteroidota bacterium]